MRRILAVASLALALLLAPASAAPAASRTAPHPDPSTALRAAGAPTGALALSAPASQRPVFTEYLVCFNGWVFADFTDPDGDDTKLHGFAYVFKNDGNSVLIKMTISIDPVHGVFFYTELAASGLKPSDVGMYLFGAVDETGTWSFWAMADGACNVL